MNRAGQKMSDLPVTPAKAGGTHQIDMGLNADRGRGVSRRDHREGRDPETKELVAVRVTS